MLHLLIKSTNLVRDISCILFILYGINYPSNYINIRTWAVTTEIKVTSFSSYSDHISEIKVFTALMNRYIVHQHHLNFPSKMDYHPHRGQNNSYSHQAMVRGAKSLITL